MMIIVMMISVSESQCYKNITTMTLQRGFGQIESKSLSARHRMTGCFAHQRYDNNQPLVAAALSIARNHSSTLTAHCAALSAYSMSSLAR